MDLNSQAVSNMKDYDVAPRKGCVDLNTFNEMSGYANQAVAPRKGCVDLNVDEILPLMK